MDKFLGLSSLTVLLLLLVLGVEQFQAVRPRTVRYRLADNVPVDTEIGDVGRDTKIFEDADQLSSPTFLLIANPREPITNHLWIHIQSGVLRTRSSVDRDELCPTRTTCDLEANIQVRMAQGQVVIVKAILTLEDDNDNGPLFPQDEFRVTVSEATRSGTVIPLPKATDLDSPRNGIVRYALINKPQMFHLRQMNDTGTIEVYLMLTSELDRETSERYDMKLVAYDGGQPSRSGSTTIVVDVLDVNDNSPSFEKDFYEVFVMEDVPPGTVITRVKATDRDSDANGRILYELDPSSPGAVRSLFHVDQLTGDISTLDFLDYESSIIHTLMVLARDNGPDAVPGQVRVIVRLMNCNDNPPSIAIQIPNELGGEEVFLSEGSPLGTLVVWFNVKDADSSDGEPNCTLNDDQFRLEKNFPNEYQIVTSKVLDRETHPRLTVIISCQDGGQPSLTGTGNITITVEDENDNAPQFLERSYSREIPEDHPVSEPLLRVSAVDIDLGENANVVYAIAADDGADALTIDAQTGVIYSRIAFDRERQQVVSVIVIASDSGNPRMTSSVNVTFLILDVDDEIAKFSQDTFTFTILENQPPNTVVGQVHATDSDLPPFNRFHYHLPENEITASFQMDPDTGIIRSTREFDRELKDMERFQVIVCGENTDPAAPTPDCSSAQVTVIIMDENDNDPMIIYPLPSETVFIGTRFSNGQAIVRIRAMDPDSEDSGRLVFRIANRSESYFRLDENTGEILANRDLTIASNQNLTLHVVVSDCGQPPRSLVVAVNMVVNETMSSLRNGHMTTILSGYNLVIVIVIACVSGLVAVLLLVAIFCLLQRMSSKKPQRAGEKGGRMHFADSKMTGMELRDRKTGLPSLTDSSAAKMESSLAGEDFPFFFDRTQYPDVQVWTDSKQSPQSYDTTNERDSEDCGSKPSANRRFSLTMHSSDSGRGSSEEVVTKNKQLHSVYARDSEASKESPNETTPTFNFPNQLTSFKLQNSAPLHRENNFDSLGNKSAVGDLKSNGQLTTARHRPNIPTDNSSKLIWKIGEKEHQKEQDHSTLNIDRFSRNHPELLVDCNAFPTDNNPGSFV